MEKNFGDSSVPPTDPGTPPRDERPSAECQMLRERVATLHDSLFYLLGRSQHVAQWADAVWTASWAPTGFHPAWSDIKLLRVAIDSVLAECSCPQSCATVEPTPGIPAVPLTRDCTPGQFVTWTNVQGWTFTGTLKEWDNGTAIIEWPMIQTPLIAV